MSLRKPSLRKPLSMTSLIDVIFLLLLFFMLSSTFSKFSEIDLPVSGGRFAAGTDVTRAFLRVDGETTTLNGVSVETANLRSAVEDKTQGAPLSLIVSLTASTTAQSLTDVLVALRGLQDVKLTLLGANT